MERIKLQIQNKTTILAECLEISQYVQDINCFTYKKHRDACPYAMENQTYDEEGMKLTVKINEYLRQCPSYHWSYSINHCVDSAPYYYCLWSTLPHPTGIYEPGKERQVPAPKFCGHARLCDWRKVFDKMLAGMTLEEANL